MLTKLLVNYPKHKQLYKWQLNERSLVSVWVGAGYPLYIQHSWNQVEFSGIFQHTWQIVLSVGQVTSGE